MQKNIYITARAMVNVLSVILHKKNVILKPVAGCIRKVLLKYLYIRNSDIRISLYENWCWYFPIPQIGSIICISQ